MDHDDPRLIHPVSADSGVELRRYVIQKRAFLDHVAPIWGMIPIRRKPTPGLKILINWRLSVILVDGSASMVHQKTSL
jgi:hypothetical protein